MCMCKGVLMSPQHAARSAGKARGSSLQTPFKRSSFSWAAAEMSSADLPSLLLATWFRNVWDALSRVSDGGLMLCRVHLMTA